MENQENKIDDKKDLNTNPIEEKKNHINHFNDVQIQKIEQLKLQLLKNQKKINDIKLRNLANIENIKKNTKAIIKKIKEEETLEFLKSIILVVDSLEEVIKLSYTLNLNNEPLIQGIVLIVKSLFQVLYKIGVKVEDQNNKLFDPEIHIPILIESSEKQEPKKIISIIKKGFMFNNVLLRKATVTIPKQ